MEIDYFMMRRVLQWQHFWQFFILWIITIVQSPGVLKHKNQHHINVANYQNQKIGWKKVFVCHKWNGHSFHLSHADWQRKVWFCTWLIVEYTIPGNEAPSYILSSHYQYTRVPRVLGPIKLPKVNCLHHGEALVIEWKAIACRLLLCEFSGWSSEWNRKKPNRQIRLFGSPE